MALISRMSPSLPGYEELLVEYGTLEGNAWQVWNRPGQEKDRLGGNVEPPVSDILMKSELDI